MEPPTDDDALRFLADGTIPGVAAPDTAARRTYLRACLKVGAFKEKAWPHFVCFVDASNIARRRKVPIHETNTPKARIADLDTAVAALKKLRYVPFVVSDGNLFHLIDEPYEYQKKYTEYPHSVAQRRQADNIILHALRKLPEAACLTNDRFSKPDEIRDYADVLALPDVFFRHRWDATTDSPDDDAPRFIAASDGDPMPDALTRFARRFG